jgi:hypothetical protein
MVSIIGESELKKMSDARKISNKIESKTLTSQVNEVFTHGAGKKSNKGKIVIKGGGGGRGRKGGGGGGGGAPKIDPRLYEMLEQQCRGGKYQEYKSSIREALHYGMCWVERNSSYRSSLKDKIVHSRDIQSILDNKLSGFNYIQNENLILALTVLSKIIENRVGGGTQSLGTQSLGLGLPSMTAPLGGKAPMEDTYVAPQEPSTVTPNGTTLM